MSSIFFKSLEAWPKRTVRTTQENTMLSVCLTWLKSGSNGSGRKITNLTFFTKLFWVPLDVSVTNHPWFICLSKPHFINSAVCPLLVTSFWVLIQWMWIFSMGLLPLEFISGLFICIFTHFQTEVSPEDFMGFRFWSWHNQLSPLHFKCHQHLNCPFSSLLQFHQFLN